MRSPSWILRDSMRNPIFLPNAPDRKPRTECGCQPVAFIRRFNVTPPDCCSNVSTLAVLLPWRPRGAVAALAAFVAWLSLWADFALAGATRGFGAAPLALWGGSGVSGAWAGSRFSVVDVVMVDAPLAVMTAVTT